MANRKSKITAELELKGQAQFKSGLRDIEGSARRTSRAMDSLSNAGPGGRRGFGRLTEINSGVQLATTGLRALKPIADAVQKALDNDSSLETLAMGLASVSDGSERLSTQFTKLRIASQLPGTGFKELAAGSRDLQAVGMSAADSRDVLVELGNALASIGKGKSELDGMSTALSQMFGKGRVSAEEVNQLAERLPSIRKFAAEIQTTDPGEFTRGLTKELAKLPRATGTARDSVDNLADSFDQALGQFTQGRVTGTAKALADGANDILNGTKDLDTVEKTFRKTFDTIANQKGQSPFDKYELGAKETEERKRMKGELEASDKARKEKLLANEIELMEAESRRQEAIVSNNRAAILAAEQEVAVLQDKKKLMETIGISEERAVAHIKERVALEVEANNISKDADLKKRETSFSRDLAESEAKAGGMSDRRFKKLRKENAVASETESLVSEGVDPAQAKALAERKVNADTRIAENEDRASRGLRPRIRTITDKAETMRNRFNRMSSGDRNRLEGLSSDEDAKQTFMRKQRGGIDAYGQDDALDVRPRESNLPKRIQGAGAKKREPEKDTATPGQGRGIGEQLGILIKETQAVRAAIDRGNKPDGKPISVR